VSRLVEVRSLAVELAAGNGVRRRVVDGVSFAVDEGETLGVVGESGCGKTISTMALLRLLPDSARVVRGSVSVAGVDVLAAGEDELIRLRGGVVGMVFQDPSQALDPVRTVGAQVAEAAFLHRRVRGWVALREAALLLEEVGLTPPEPFLRAYPHQLSGGQKQRALLATALSGRPRLLVADELTSALDSVARAQLVELLGGLRARRGLALVAISHDLALVASIAGRVAVLYAGETVETGPAREVFAEPLHPYTAALLAAAPRAAGPTGPLPSIPGIVPRPSEWPSGCRFAPRCARAFDRCRAARPALVEVRPDRSVRCFLHADDEAHDG